MRCCSPISAPTGRAKFPLALLDGGFSGFPRERVVKFSAAAGMTEYSEELKLLMTALFPPQDVRETLGEVMAEHHLKQLRIAETEKYAHVTFFLNARARRAFRRRRPHPGAQPQGFDLRSQAGNERRSGHRQIGRGDRIEANMI